MAFMQTDRTKFKPAREHDYIFDNLFVVSGEKDHYKAARKAAMASAQKTVVPVFETMFSELQTQVTAHTVYHTNCRLPPHMKISYFNKTQEQLLQDKHVKVMGKDRFRYFASPKTVIPKITVTLPQEPNQQTIATPRIISAAPVKEKHDKTVQTQYRESSAQTVPYQTDYKIADSCVETPEVLFLDKLEVKVAGRGGSKCVVEENAVEEVIRGRVQRAWLNNVSSMSNLRVLRQLAAADQSFREQQVEKNLLNGFAFKLPVVFQRSRSVEANKKTERVWMQASNRLHKTLDTIQRNKQREMSKLELRYFAQAKDWKKEKGFTRNSICIRVNPEFLPSEDEFRFTHKSPDPKTKWRDAEQRCKRKATMDTKTLLEMQQYFKGISEEPSKGEESKLYNYLLPESPPRRKTVTQLNGARSNDRSPLININDGEESNIFEAAVLLQRVLKGRAVQAKIYEDLSRKCELIHELVRSDCYKAENSVDMASSKTLPAAYEILKNRTAGHVLHLLSKELDLQMEVENDVDILTAAENERCQVEAAEAGRRQVEERRRREHDEMFSQIMTVTEESLEGTLKKIFSDNILQEADLYAEVEVKKLADIIHDKDIRQSQNDNELESAEFIADLIMNVVLPQTVKSLSREQDAD